MRLWFRIVASHRALLAQAPAAVRHALWAKERSGIFASAWEELCRQSVVMGANARTAHTRKGPWLPAARYWQGSGPEWDVVSRSIDGKRGMLGEVKWSERAFRRGEIARIAEELRGKGVPPALGQTSELVYCVFVPKAESGVREIGGTLVVDAATVVAAGA